jgi:hypothetical protein
MLAASALDEGSDRGMNIKVSETQLREYLVYAW